MRLADATLGNAGLQFFMCLSFTQPYQQENNCSDFWSYLFAFDASNTDEMVKLFG